MNLDVFSRIDKIMLPGDYIAMKLTGEICSTISGLSEGMFWDFQSQAPAQFLLDYYGIPTEMLPELKPTFSEQGKVSRLAAGELGCGGHTGGLPGRGPAQQCLFTECT